MDLQSSVEFAAALIVVVGSGIVLGMVIRPKDKEAIEWIQARKTILYSEIVMSMDNLVQSSAEYKQYFIQRYYQALIYAPDSVVRALNAYMEVAAKDSSGEDLLAARDTAVFAMRRDVAARIGSPTKLRKSELQTIEVEHRVPDEPVNSMPKKSNNE